MPLFFSRSSARDFYAHLGITQWIRAGVALFFVLLSVGYGIGFAVSSSNATKASQIDYERRLAIFTLWQTDLTQHLTKATSLSASVASFAAAGAKVPMNASAPAADRMIVDSPEAFDMMCDDLTAELPGIFSMLLLTGGVSSQVCPKGSVRLGFDTYYSTNYASTYRELFEVLGPVVLGPTHMATVQGGISINAWFPIFINGSTVPRSRVTFWGSGLVIIELNRLMAAKNVSSLLTDHGMEYVLWWDETSTANGTRVAESTVVLSSLEPSQAEARRTVMTNGMRMSFPVAERGKTTYFAMHPRSGPVSDAIPARAIGLIVVVVLAGTLAVVSTLFLALYAHFLFRHRHAPSTDNIAFFSAMTLHGAQPIADRAPLEAVRMFAEFTARVRRMAAASGCYVVCDIGDRTVYVAAKDATQLVMLCQSIVFDVIVQTTTAPRLPNPAIRTLTMDERDESEASRSASRTVDRSRYSRSRTITRDSRTRADTHTNQSSSAFIGSVVCRPSAALHAATARYMYDSVKDAYFFGNAADVGKLCGALDRTKGGEVGWTAAAEEACGAQCSVLESSAVSCHTVSEGAVVVLHVASLWKETGNERDNEDPSVAMAALSDAYMRRMTVIVSEGWQEARQRMHNKKNGKSGNRSSKGADAAALSRSATLLHIAMLDGARLPLDVVRRVVAEEKGVVVSGHENMMVAAFNLMTPGGHHQVRAADAVVRLRAALPNTSFVCSLHHGKVSALIADGLVVCSGEAVSAGRTLLDRAVALRSRVMSSDTKEEESLNSSISKEKVVDCFDSSTEEDSDGGVRGVRTRGESPTNAASMCLNPNRPVINAAVDAADPDLHGLCLLYCHSEMSSTYECEAVDVVTSAPGRAEPDVKSRVAYRLAHRKNGMAAVDDEWMYQLRDEENQSPFAAVNTVFNRIAAGDRGEAARLWAKISADPIDIMGVSVVARRSLEQYTSSRKY